MKRRFTIPVFGAAAFHAALFWGFGGPVPAPVAAPPDRTEPMLVPFAIPPVVDDAVPAETPAPRGEPRPSLPEPLRAAGPSDIAIAIPPSGPPVPFLPDHIVAGPVGVPGGVADGVGRPGNVWNASVLDNSPMPRVQVAPVYPSEARRLGLDGTVQVGFTVDESGRVVNPHVISRTDPIFEAAALRAVAKWRFAPGRYHGRVVRFRMAVPIVFHLNESTS
jgi:protein TonB